MTASFVVVPEWQASGSDRAMRLVDGAEAIRGDLPAASTVTVDVPLEAGDELGTGVHRAGTLRIVHERTREVLAGVDGLAITIGGDCGVSLASVGYANEQRAGDMAVVWLDAHPDLNTPASSPSGCFAGMVLRAICGDGVDGLVAPLPIDPSRVVLAGARSFDDAEDAYIADHGIAVVSAEQLATPDALLAAIAATGATSVYLHIDVDVLDPAEIVGLGNPVPFGVTGLQLVDLARTIAGSYEIAGATIAQFAPVSAEAAIDDLPTLLRVIGAIAGR